MELKLKAAHNDDMHSLLAQHLGPEGVEINIYILCYIHIIFMHIYIDFFISSGFKG